MDLAQSRVVVTGASRGLGAQLARELAGRGARVVLVARTEAALRDLAAEVGGEVVVADLGADADVAALVPRLEADGPVDVLVNNAGIDLAGGLGQLSEDEIRAVLAVNLVAPMLLCRAVIPGMRTRGRGHLVNVSSMAAVSAVPGLAAYSTSKAGLSHFTATLRAELKHTAIGTTLVEVGPVLTPMLDSVLGYEPTRRAFRRLARLQLLPDLDAASVATSIANAIERDRRHVRLPRRDVVFPMLAEAPRRITAALLVGLPVEVPGVRR